MHPAVLGGGLDLEGEAAVRLGGLLAPVLVVELVRRVGPGVDERLPRVRARVQHGALGRRVQFGAVQVRRGQAEQFADEVVAAEDEHALGGRDAEQGGGGLPRGQLPLPLGLFAVALLQLLELVGDIGPVGFAHSVDDVLAPLGRLSGEGADAGGADLGARGRVFDHGTDEVVVVEGQQLGGAGDAHHLQRLGLGEPGRSFGLRLVPFPLLVEPVRVMDAGDDEGHVIGRGGAEHRLLGRDPYGVEQLPRVPGLLPQGVDEVVVAEQEYVGGRVETDHGGGVHPLGVGGADARGPGRRLGRGAGGEDPRGGGAERRGERGGDDDAARDGPSHSRGRDRALLHTVSVIPTTVA